MSNMSVLGAMSAGGYVRGGQKVQGVLSAGGYVRIPGRIVKHLTVSIS